MTLYALRRLTAGLVLAVLVTMITFLLLSTSFDNVAGSVLGNGATPQQVVAQKAQMGLDRPLAVQYLDWLS
ncbi:ABC transporter permease, partial [Streptomyces sp. NPDC005921]